MSDSLGIDSLVDPERLNSRLSVQSSRIRDSQYLVTSSTSTELSRALCFSWTTRPVSALQITRTSRMTGISAAQRLLAKGRSREHVRE